jgi:hypothetical protein
MKLPRGVFVLGGDSEFETAFAWEHPELIRWPRRVVWRVTDAGLLGEINCLTSGDA